MYYTVVYRGLYIIIVIIYNTFFYLLPCPGHAGYCGDSMRGVPDVHNFFYFPEIRKFRNFRWIEEAVDP
jgi:hypothetical protein